MSASLGSRDVRLNLTENRLANPMVAGNCNDR
jgi:hypothetical protein